MDTTDNFEGLEAYFICLEVFIQTRNTVFVSFRTNCLLFFKRIPKSVVIFINLFALTDVNHVGKDSNLGYNNCHAEDQYRNHCTIQSTQDSSWNMC